MNDAPAELTYLQWNDRLTAHFFNREMSGRPVHLYVTPEVLERVGSGNATGLVRAARRGPLWGDMGGPFCQLALQAFERWRRRKLAYPPYVGYLCVFVLAAGAEGDFAQHAYYPRLRQLLGLGPGGALPGFDRMLDLWEDLERWSSDDMGGEFGVFEAISTGGMIHVGYPLAQATLSEAERHALPAIFAAAALDPAAPPPGGALARLVLDHEGHRLRARTRQLLERRDDSELRRALIDVLTAALEGWSGRFEGDVAGDAAGARVFAPLRLCLALDQVARRARATLRLRVGDEFPQGRLQLAAPGAATWWCEELGQGWSTALKEDAIAVDASALDWSRNLAIRALDSRLVAQLPGREARVFVDGRAAGLPGLLEAHALPRGEPFHLAFQERLWPNLERWSRKGGPAFEDAGATAGLPPGWRLLRAGPATNDEGIRDALPHLAFPSTARVRFEGGLRSGVGQRFFAFAPPAVRVEGAEEDAVWCDGSLLERGPGDAYALPPGLPLDERVTVEARRGDRPVARQSLQLTGIGQWRWREALVEFDRWGKPLAGVGEGRLWVAGAYVAGEPPGAGDFRRAVLFLDELEGVLERGTRVFFAGRAPGQIVSWPAEPLPTAWDPEWAILLARRGRVVYCGEAKGPPAPLDADRRRIDLWRDVLWHRRRRIAPPPSAAHARLWRALLEAARDA